MTRMPDFEAEIARDAAAIGHGITGLFQHHHAAPDGAPHAPASRPDTQAAPAAATPQENTVSLATIEDDVKTDLTQGIDWMEGFVKRVKAAAPGIIATSEAVGGSTVGQVAEMLLGKFLPPDVEAELLALVKRYVTTFGQPAPQAAQPQPTFQPAPAPQQ